MDTALAQLYDRLSALEQENAMLRSHLQRCEQTCTVLQAEVAEYKQREQEWQTQTEIAREHAGRAIDLENGNSPGETLGDSPTETPRDRILEATAAAANALLTVKNFDEAVNTALQIIGECLDTDRVAVIENFDVPSERLPYWRVLYEWDAPHTPSQRLHPAAMQGRHEDMEELYKQFIQGQSVSYLLEEMPELLRSALAEVGVKATHIVPIFVEDQFWGVVGFDDCREAKRRSAAELSVLRVAADCIGSAIKRERTQQALLQAEQTRSKELERINTELQQTLNRLTESEQRYRQLLELASEGIFRVEYEVPISVTLSVEEQVQQIYQHYRVVEHNLAFAQMYGYEQPNAMVGARLTDWHIADAPQNAAQMEQFIRNGHQMRNQETVEFDRFGCKRHFLNNGFSIIRDGYAIGGWGTQIDITELRQTQQALLEAEQARVAELAKANEELQQREQEVQRSYRLLSVVAQVTKDLLEAEDVDIAISAALRAVGEVANMSRVVLILEHQDPSTQKLKHHVEHEWVAVEIFDHHAVGMSLMDNDDFQVLVQSLYNRQSVWHVISDLPDITRLLFERLEVKSTGVVPIFIEGHYIGCVGFDDCVTPRQWSQQEIDVLTAAAESIGAALHRKQLVDRLVEERIHAEQERVAELKKANEALARTSERLAEQPDLSAFLSHIALEASAQLGADGAMLSTLDEQRQVLRAVAHVEQGHIPVSTLAAEMPVDEAGFVKVLLETRKPRYFNLEQEAHLFWAGSIEYHHQRNHKAVMGVPLYAGGNLLGHLGLAFTHTEPIKEQGSELLYALAQQAALAIQLTRLAEEAKQAAIAREQEKAAQERAEQLARANNALQKTVATLTTRRDLDGFIGEVLHTIARELDSPLVEYWTVLGIDTVEVETWIYANQLCSIRQGDDHPSRGGIRLLRDYIGFEDFTQRSQSFTFDAPMPAYSLAAEEVICPTDWYAARGVAQHFNFPLQAGDITIGSISVWMPFDREINEESLRLGQTLSHQTALAIQLTRLAEEAKQAAIAREQEKAAQERAAELAAANRALQRGVEWLVASGTINAVLDSFLLETVAVTGAAAGAVMRRGLEHEFIMQSLVENGRAIYPFDLHAPEEVYRQRTAADTSGIMRRTAEGEIVVFPVEGFEAKGYQGTCSCVLMVGDRPFGMLAMAFPQPVAFRSVEEELILALTQQIALVIQLTTLGEADKQAAIAREQEKAAQERAAELAKANDALKRSLDTLAAEPGLERFLGYVLTEIVRQSDACTAHLFLYNPETNTLALCAAFKENTLYFEPAPGDPPMFCQPFDADITTAWRSLIADRTIYLCTIDTQDEELTWEETKAWHITQGHSAHADIALVAGNQPFGFLGIAWRDKITLTTEQTELVHALANQATLAIQLTRLAEEAKQAAIFEERNRMASEIHDTLAQAFTGISLQLEVAKSLVHQDPQTVQQILDHLSRLAETGLAEARRSVWALYPPAAEYADLAQMLYESLEQMTRNTSTSVEVNLQGTPCALPPLIGMNLLRIGQEAITNALKHAQAQTITIELSYEPDRICLTIRDNGCGFNPPTDIDSLNGGFGLMGMYERCDRIGAQLSLTSQLGQGTQILVEAPLS